MRQALMIGVRPSTSVGMAYPRVPLPLGPGDWAFVTENLKDTKVRITHERSVATESGITKVKGVCESPPCRITGPISVTVEIIEPGNEDFINVLAVSIK